MKDINDIDWSKLEHAYGRAEDIPELLLMLRSDFEEDRENAIRSFYGNIYHQGTIYQATGYTIPFLLELLFDSDIDNKGSLLGLLANIAYGEYRSNAEVKVIDELKKANSNFFNFLCSENLEYKIFSIQILSKTENNKTKLEEAIVTQLEKATISETKIHLFLGLYLVKNGKIDVKEFKKHFSNARDRSLKTILACLVLKSSTDKNYKEEISYVINGYLEQEETLELFLTYWSITELYISEEDSLLNMENQILNKYFEQIKNKEKVVRKFMDKGNRMYKMTDYYCLLSKSVFQDKFELIGSNEQQKEVINKVFEFYRLTGSEMYNSWLINELYHLYVFLEMNFKINFSFDELKKKIYTKL